MQKSCTAILILFFVTISPFAQNQDSNQTPEQWANQLKTARLCGTLDALMYFAKNPIEAKKQQQALEEFSKACDVDSLKKMAEGILGEAKKTPSKSDPAHIKELIKTLKESKDEKVLQPILEEISTIGPAAKDTAPELIRILNDNPNMAISSQVSRALLQIGADLKPVIAGLIQKFQASQDVKQKSNYAFSIGLFGPAAGDAVPGLLPVLDSTDDQLKSRVILALGYIHSCSEQVVPKIVANLKKGSFPIRQVCCMALANFAAS